MRSDLNTHDLNTDQLTIGAREPDALITAQRRNVIFVASMCFLRYRAGF